MGGRLKYSNNEPVGFLIMIFSAAKNHEQLIKKSEKTVTVSLKKKHPGLVRLLR